ncbi:MAG: class I SAM-dependent methyltransferase [Flavobacteriales bacterium]|nr:class I SAM-dependent methyltransferase [Flavobacteriales bacterium]
MSESTRVKQMAKKKSSGNPYLDEGGAKYHEEVNGGLNKKGFALIERRRTKKIGRFVDLEYKIFEYGVGPGWNISGLDCAEKIGFDIAVSLQTQVEGLGIKFINKIGEEQSGRYDLIICSHVLEHLENPAEALESMKTLLKPAGQILIYLPLEHGYYRKRPNKKDRDHHLFTWSIGNFTNLSDSLGFEIIEYKRRKFGYERIFAILLQNRLTSFRLYSTLIWLALLIRPDFELEFLLKPVKK